MYKNNAVMSITVFKELSKRENETLERLKKYQSISILLKGFFSKGFRSFPALKSIVCHYYPDTDITKLKDIWNFRAIDMETSKRLEIVFEKLNGE